MRTPAVVAIDGPAGSGKSTLARALALELELPYVNTGLMYRVLTAEAIRRGVSADDQEGLLALTERSRFSLGGARPRELQVEGYTEDELTTPTVERTVSEVAAHPRVRAWMRDAQRILGADGAVMEGRDIGSVVFPDARIKIYLVAHADERSDRRAGDRIDRPPEDVSSELRARDELDARTNPFAPSSGAVVIDTGTFDAAATLRIVLELIGERAPDLLR
jgi:cytidylate kinase